MGISKPLLGQLKKATSGVLAKFRCSRTNSTLRAKNCLQPCWMDFFEPTQSLWQAAWLWANWLLEFSISQHSPHENGRIAGFGKMQPMGEFFRPQILWITWWVLRYSA